MFPSVAAINLFVNLAFLCNCFQISATDFSLEPNLKQFVFLQARFPDAELEKAVLVSFQSVYIYIQTDKTLYTPNSKGETLQSCSASTVSADPTTGRPDVRTRCLVFSSLPDVCRDATHAARGKRQPNGYFHDHSDSGTVFCF